ncbi:hypothetical protein [Microbispora bryophytorum]|uniref:hypothetical protein n=1 Tax=Microbispora bryophytorum TaxID=1460882 RepID=UPI00115B1B5E|nr:hypothetical protein [Microbispora bryophytorum]MBD3136934.1 hypothetical protein [Microbispora bryophytorum]TQS07203.1 hypothetical protein FLX07_10905 [Microbispora bryophytorum]
MEGVAGGVLGINRCWARPELLAAGTGPRAACPAAERALTAITGLDHPVAEPTPEQYAAAMDRWNTGCRQETAPH